MARQTSHRDNTHTPSLTGMAIFFQELCSPKRLLSSGSSHATKWTNWWQYYPYLPTSTKINKIISISAALATVSYHHSLHNKNLAKVTILCFLTGTYSIQQTTRTHWPYFDSRPIRHARYGSKDCRCRDRVQVRRTRPLYLKGQRAWLLCTWLKWCHAHFARAHVRMWCHNTIGWEQVGELSERISYTVIFLPAFVYEESKSRTPWHRRYDSSVTDGETL